jgi:hypothetical protein
VIDGCRRHIGSSDLRDAVFSQLTSVIIRGSDVRISIEWSFGGVRRALNMDYGHHRNMFEDAENEQLKS